MGNADIRGFWSWFAEHHRELLDIVAGRRAGRVTELVDAALAAAGLALTYEVTGTPYGAELTFTPRGDPQLASFIDRLVAAAPSFDSWVIHGRRQRKSLASALAITKALHGLDISGARVKVRFTHEQYFLQFLHAELAALEEDQRYAVAVDFLDYALGEHVAMSFIGGLDFKPAGDGIETALVINQIIRETQGTDIGLSQALVNQAVSG